MAVKYDGGKKSFSSAGQFKRNRIKSTLISIRLRLAHFLFRVVSGVANEAQIGLNLSLPIEEPTVRVLD